MALNCTGQPPTQRLSPGWTGHRAAITADIFGSASENQSVDSSSSRDTRCMRDSRAGALRRWGRLAPHLGVDQVRPRRLSLAAKLGLVPLGLGGVLDHHQLVEPLLLDIAAEAAVVDDPRFGRRMEAAGAWCAEATSAASRLRTPLPLVDGAFFSPDS